MVLHMHSKIKSDLVKLFESNGWSKGRTETYQKELKGMDGRAVTYRYKIQEISLRKESLVHHSNGEKSWVCLWSAYLKDIEVGEKITVKKKM